MNKQSCNDDLKKLIFLYNSFYPNSQLRCNKCKGGSEGYQFETCRCLDTYEVLNVDKIFKQNENEDVENIFNFEEYNSVYLMHKNGFSTKLCVDSFQYCKIDKESDASLSFISPYSKADNDNNPVSDINQVRGDSLELFAKVLLLYDINCTHEIEVYQCSDQFSLNRDRLFVHYFCNNINYFYNYLKEFKEYIKKNDNELPINYVCRHAILIRNVFKIFSKISDEADVSKIFKNPMSRLDDYQQVKEWKKNDSLYSEMKRDIFNQFAKMYRKQTLKLAPPDLGEEIGEYLILLDEILKHFCTIASKNSDKTSNIFFIYILEEILDYIEKNIKKHYHEKKKEKNLNKKQLKNVKVCLRKMRTYVLGVKIIMNHQGES